MWGPRRSIRILGSRAFLLATLCHIALIAFAVTARAADLALASVVLYLRAAEAYKGYTYMYEYAYGDG